MRTPFLIFVLLIIYSGFFAEIQAQEKTLIISAEKELGKGFIDSLRLRKYYQDHETILKKTDTLLKTFQQMGFVDADFKGLSKLNDSSYQANFYLGKRFRRIRIYYSEADFYRHELKKIFPETSQDYLEVTIEKLPRTLHKLVELRNKRGDAFARLRLTEIEKSENGYLMARLFLERSNHRTIDSIIIRGYEKFPRPFIKHYAGIKAGNIFDRNKLLKQNEHLNNLGFASAKKTPEVLFRKDSTIVYLYLEKENNNLFDGIIGFATDEETQKLELNGYLNLQLNNNLNFGEQLSLNYKADGKEQLMFKVKVELPYLFQSPIGTSGELNLFKRDSTFITAEQQYRTTYQVNPASQVYLGFRGYTSTILLEEGVAGIPVDDFKSQFFVTGTSFEKNQSSRLFPVKTTIVLDLGAGTRVRKNKKESQYTLQSEMGNIFQLNKNNSIFIKNTTSILFSQTHLVNELYRFGGINSIRGFDENSIDASLFSVLNGEYRHQFNEGIYMNTITDMAYFENQVLNLRQRLYSFGLGIGLVTKAGLFRIVAANGITQAQNFDFSNTKIHISVSSRF